MNKLLNTPDRIDEAFLSSLIKKENDKLVYRKKGYGEIETERPLSSIRLELALDYSGFSQNEIAQQANVPQGSISRIVTGKTLKSTHLPALSKVLNLDERWLSGKEIDEVNLNQSTLRLYIGANTFVVVKDYDPNSNQENLIDARLIGEKIVPKNLRFIIANDQSMSPDIRIGSSAIFDITQTSIVNGEIYALKNGNQIQFRQLFIEHDNSIRIKARNADFYEYIINPTHDDFIILGRIICVINRLV